MKMLVDKRITQHKYVFAKLRNLGVDIPEGVDEFNVFSFYMTELWNRGENPLQNFYKKKSQELGLDLDGIEIKCFVSFYMTELWNRGENTLQLWFVKMCHKFDIPIVGNKTPQQLISRSINRFRNTYQSSNCSLQIQPILRRLNFHLVCHKVCKSSIQGQIDRPRVKNRLTTIQCLYCVVLGQMIGG